MSVLKTKRNLSTVQFLTNLVELMNDVRSWAKSQSRKDDHYGLIALYESTQNALNHALMANSIMPNSNEKINYRKKNFDITLSHLRQFNSLVTIMAVTRGVKLSNNRIKHWEKLVYISTKQIDAIKKSDERKIIK